MIPSQLAERLERLRTSAPGLRAYALVDGYQYAQHFGHPLKRRWGAVAALFAGTEDEPLADAGPWVIDLAAPEAFAIASLAELEEARPSVMWLFADQELDALVATLQGKLNSRLPDGRVALVRFWDPRVFVPLFNALDSAGRQSYFGDVSEWHGLRNGKRFHVSHHA
ncbi:hypothetical protein AWB64_02519 [Caballeronia sordidicola]|uniref:DUF4123 domain-containing protein n=1 Tax=Caballeronia sordidicola TaxID=196367 RepID=A0A158GDR5_CABSO|nr:DUF4123 domain-containing protein [Caballeronia sordidicola]SAL29530.1 hypothetical protein AWB64_02519 [Caballeronia sordidicola]